LFGLELSHVRSPLLDYQRQSKLKELQKYFQGGCFYIPIHKENQKAWGELSGYREELKQRNTCIIQEFHDGCSINSLAKKYHLSTHAIKKIVY